MKHWRILLAIALAIGLVFAVRSCSSELRDKQYDADLADARVVHRSQKLQEKVSAKTDIAIAVLKKAEAQHVARSDSIAAVADTLGQSAATVRDSLEMWHSRYVAEDSSRKEERSARLTADARADSAIIDRDRWKAQAFSADTINVRISRDLEQARNCRIVFFVPCPTRVQVAIGSAALGAYVATHPKQTKAFVVKLFSIGVGR